MRICGCCRSRQAQRWWWWHDEVRYIVSLCNNEGVENPSTSGQSDIDVHFIPVTSCGHTKKIFRSQEHLTWECRCVFPKTLEVTPVIQTGLMEGTSWFLTLRLLRGSVTLRSVYGYKRVCTRAYMHIHVWTYTNSHKQTHTLSLSFSIPLPPPLPRSRSLNTLVTTYIWSMTYVPLNCHCWKVYIFDWHDAW